MLWANDYFYKHGLTIIPALLSNYIYHKAYVQLLIHSQTSTVVPLKFGNGYIISSHALQGIWLLTRVSIKIGPCWKGSYSVVEKRIVWYTVLYWLSRLVFYHILCKYANHLLHAMNSKEYRICDHYSVVEEDRKFLKCLLEPKLSINVCISWLIDGVGARARWGSSHAV